MRGFTMDKRVELLVIVFVLLVGAIIWPKLFGGSPEFEDFVAMVLAAMSLLGASKEKKKRKQRKLKPRKVKPFRLTPSFDSGLYGGLIGGAITGLIINLVYCGIYLKSVDWMIISRVFICTSAAGTLWGASFQLIILWFRYLVTEKQYSELVFNEVSGGILVGVMGGGSLGALGAWIFFIIDYPAPDPGLIVTSSVLGGICFVLSVLLYEYEGRWRDVMRSLLVSAVISIFLASLAFIVLERAGITDIFLQGPTRAEALTVGPILGLVIGIVLGFQIGCTLLLDRLRQVMPEPNK